MKTWKALGKYKGRARTVMAKAGEVEKLLANDVRPTDVARKLEVEQSSGVSGSPSPRLGRSLSVQTR